MAAQSMQITLQPTVLRWARERASLSAEELASKLQVKPERVLAWELSGNITMAQSRRLAGATYTPHGFLFLPEAPDDHLPIADFRTRSNEPERRPSPDLLDTVYSMQRRQEWMRDEFVRHYEEPPIPFLGEFTIADDPSRIAVAMRDALGITDGWAESVPNWSAALRHLRDRSEEAGILVVFNGIVGNNTHRKLDAGEFQGFALVDEHAPLIFVNNADYKAAQMFTLAHELVHIFVGESGVSHFEGMQPADHATEVFCDKTAAEFLVPEGEFRNYWNEVCRTSEPYSLAARQFKVSTVVVARRALDLDLTPRSAFFEFYNQYKDNEWQSSRQPERRGNFWLNQIWRVGPRFASAVYRAVKEGRLTYAEGYSLTDLRGKTFEKIPQELGASS